jgi:hypothetical protein
MQHRPWRNSPYQLTTLIAVALLLLILFVSGGYFLMLPDSATIDRRDTLLSSFNNNLAYWESRRPIEFEYIVERACFCAPDYIRPYRVRERSEYRDTSFVVLIDIEPTDIGSPPEPVTIDGLFALLADAITAADEVSVIYDPAFGFPTSVTIDWSTGQADEEQRFLVRDFQVIEYGE